MILDQFVGLWCSQCPHENAKFIRFAFCSHMKYKCSVSFPHWTGLQFFLSFLSEPITNLVSHLFFSLRRRRENGNSLTFPSAGKKNSFGKVTMGGHRPCLFARETPQRWKADAWLFCHPGLSSSKLPYAEILDSLCLSSSRDIRNPWETFKYQQWIETLLTRKKLHVFWSYSSSSLFVYKQSRQAKIGRVKRAYIEGLATFFSPTKLLELYNIFLGEGRTEEMAQ